VGFSGKNCEKLQEEANNLNVNIAGARVIRIYWFNDTEIFEGYCLCIERTAENCKGHKEYV